MTLPNVKSVQNSKVPVKLIYGDELASINHILHMIKQQIIQSGESIQPLLLDKSDILAELEREFASGSLFGGRTIVHLLVTQKLNSAQEAGIAKLVSVIESDLLIITFNLPRSGKLPWLNKLDKSKCQFFQCPTVFPNKRIGWIQDCARDLDIPITSKHAKQINQACESNLTASYDCLKHCKIFGVESLQDLLQNNQQNYAIFELLDYVLKGNTAKAVTIFDRVVRESASSIGISSIIGSRIIKLLDISLKLDQGNQSDVWNSIKISSFQKSTYKSAIGRLKQHLPSLVGSLFDIDRCQKGLGNEDGTTALRNLIVRLSSIH